MIECLLGRQMLKLRFWPPSKRPMTPPASLGSPSQRHHLVCVESIVASVRSVWWIDDGSPPVYVPPRTPRVRESYSSCRPPSEWPISCGLISAESALPPVAVAIAPPAPPYVFELPSARICRFADVVPVIMFAYVFTWVVPAVTSRCTLEALHPPQKAMLSGVTYFGEVSSGSQWMPESWETIAIAYTFM